MLKESREKVKKAGLSVISSFSPSQRFKKLFSKRFCLDERKRKQKKEFEFFFQWLLTRENFSGNKSLLFILAGSGANPIKIVKFFDRT
jgi:hypothetical protein